ncbi:hypothetical protein PR048_005580 [Dryococelus australis]|uniref:Uncharacterized protein n=1 Tax=Dryococelus australis TaxID=614101 RepID=A0ABQ9I8L3_9NEOP|nr:hypothetical protein PR048_005580 [Dryococelus australis]
MACCACPRSVSYPVAPAVECVLSPYHQRLPMAHLVLGGKQTQQAPMLTSSKCKLRLANQRRRSGTVASGRRPRSADVVPGGSRPPHVQVTISKTADEFDLRGSLSGVQGHLSKYSKKERIVHKVTHAADVAAQPRGVPALPQSGQPSDQKTVVQRPAKVVSGVMGFLVDTAVKYLENNVQKATSPSGADQTRL